MTQPNYLTRPGLDKLSAELEHLRNVRRRELTAQMQQSREMGSGGGDAEFEEIKDELAFVEGRILTLENLISSAVIIEKDRSVGDTIQIGSQVTVRHEAGKVAHYTITGTAEANPSQGKISHLSPIGQSLLGKKVGQIAEVTVPAGKTKLEIVAVK